MKKHTSSAVLILLAVAFAALPANANNRDQAKRIHDRLTGVPASETLLNQLELLVEDNDYYGAAELAMQQDAFYDVTLKNMVTPWTNEAQDSFAPLNDYTATVIGLTRDELDFRQVLYADVVYVGDQIALDDDGYSIPDVSIANNAHYEALETQGVPLQNYLTSQTQSGTYGIPSEAAAGVMTSRASAHAFFVAGTNRAMLRFTMMNHLCRDLEQVKDASLPADRIRRDVSRSPGGDSRIFMNSCVACHNGMDPLAQAFAYYDWSGEEGTDGGQLLYNGPGSIDVDTGSRVQGKYHINGNNFPYGYLTPDDGWDNYWRTGQNANLGWDAGLAGSGNGASSLGQEFAHSEAFASCQAQKVFKTVCLRTPASSADVSQVESMTSNFSSNGFRFKDLFAGAAVYCRGE